MSFNMQQVPSEPSDEAKILYAWAFLYALLGIFFSVLTLILIIIHNWLAWLGLIGTFSAFRYSRQRFEQADLYDGFDNE